MDQRRPRLGDILDDYCPRERRITNHAVVAMVEHEVKQTRCTTCDADHEYKHAKVPAARKRKAETLTAHLVEGGSRPSEMPETPDDIPEGDIAAVEMADAGESVVVEEHIDVAAAAAPIEDAVDPDLMTDEGPSERDDWPVHRPLIRATLPRPEGQVPERKAPDFTFRPGGGKFDPSRNGQRNRGHRPMRHAQGPSSGQGQGPRFGGPRPAGQGQRGPGHGGGPQGQRGNRPGQGGGAGRPGQGRGPRPGGGGRKRGR